MRSTRLGVVLATVAALALLVGVGSAAAGGGDRPGGLKQTAAQIADQKAFEAVVAKNLGTTVAKLRAAIKASAVAQINAALADKEITSDEADTLKGALDDGTLPAARLATAAGVAKELGTTADKLNAAYSDARKAQATARIDQAVKDGKITQAYADQLKAKIDDATFPGFAGGGFGFGFGKFGGPGFRMKLGFGFGPGFGFLPSKARGGGFFIPARR
jgi:hypothetical protein